ncbi:hypothetical protein [uncultured Pelagimonas sp.]|uniref:hypothetical protein n=1 Tax=uncultured Pelagimonas sp. TaxID=1618102 RepID=UPI002625049E|nr:hypothetical protein [uncultured Pelagimonas sp.]
MEQEKPKTPLILDDEVMVPPALNRHLAAVALRPKSNLYEDGYNLFLSASFGGDDLTLKIGDADVSISMDINFFEVDLTFGKSIATFGEGFSEFDVPAVGVEKGVSRSSTERGFAGEVGVDVNQIVKSRLGATGKLNSSAAKTQEKSITKYPFHHIELGCVSAGDLRDPYPLQGNVIQSYNGWWITPKSADDRSGVLARLRVKRNWIEMSNPQVQNGLGEIAFRLKKLFLGNSDGDNLKTAAFTVLLEKLVHLRLQEIEETEYATLAASAIILKPEEDRPAAVPLKPAKPPLEIDITVVEDFLNLPPRKAVKFVQDIEDRGFFSATRPVSSERFLGYRSARSKDGNSEIDPELRFLPPPEHSPVELVTILDAVKRSFLIEDHDFSISHFEDLSAVEYLAALELLIIDGESVKGIDIVVDDVPSKVLADTIVNQTRFGAIFDIYLRHPIETGGAKNTDSLYSGGLIAAALAQQVVFNISDLGEAVDEDHLLRWCKFIHVQLGRE